MPNDPTMIGLGVGAIIIIWLVFSVLKRVIGLIFLAALAAGAFVLWTNPSLLNSAKTMLNL